MDELIGNIEHGAGDGFSNFLGIHLSKKGRERAEKNRKIKRDRKRSKIDLRKSKADARRIKAAAKQTRADKGMPSEAGGLLGGAIESLGKMFGGGGGGGGGAQNYSQAPAPYSQAPVQNVEGMNSGYGNTQDQPPAVAPEPWYKQPMVLIIGGLAVLVGVGALLFSVLKNKPNK